MENFEKCAKTQKKIGEGGGGAITAPCDQDTTLYGSKPLLWKRIVNQTIVGGKNPKKTNIWPFFAYTYIRKTNIC